MLRPFTAHGQATIDFTKSTNLKAVYDAGLRPWRVNPVETTLTLTDQRVRVLPPDGSAFQMDVQIGSFAVMEGNQLGSADFISLPTTLDNAVAQTRKACAALNFSTDGLDEQVRRLIFCVRIPCHHSPV